MIWKKRKAKTKTKVVKVSKRKELQRIKAKKFSKLKCYTTNKLIVMHNQKCPSQRLRKVPY